MKILIHICCGPCAITPVETLRGMGHELTGFFLNPNIHPASEYLRRREAAAEASRRLDLPMIWRDAYDLPAWLQGVSGLERNSPKHSNPRCALCYAQRLEATAAAAASTADAFTSSLLYSRFQLHDRIAALGETAAQRHHVPFFYHDFRAGWQHGIDRSKAWGLYRQSYCGCIFSEQERFAGALATLAAPPDSAGEPEKQGRELDFLPRRTV